MKKVVTFLLVILLAGCHFRTDRKKLSGILKLPNFRILSIDSSKCISTENLSPGYPVVLIYFDPDCQHCQKETKLLISNIYQLRKTNIYWVTNGDQDELKNFYKYFRLDTLKNAIVGRDYEYSFYRAYLPSTVPFIAIYNSKKELVKIYKGEADINSIIAATRG